MSLDTPVVEWLEDLRRNDGIAYAKCVAAIGRLAELGHELRRPTSDFLRDGIHELRAKKGRVNYRLLYFFHGRSVAIVLHGITKESEVPVAEIKRAIERQHAFKTHPGRHSYKE